MSNTISNDLLTAMNPSTSTNSAQGTVDAQKNQFLTMLVTQMQNQDPLNPMDNAEVTSQLAQLSTVTGINQLNSTLTALMGSYQSSESLQATGMIGHNVLVPGSSATLASGSALMGIDLAAPADSVKLTIYDSSGVAIHTVDLGAQKAGVQPLQWDGTTDSGATADDGNYTFKVTATAAGESVDATALSLGQVNSVSTGASGVKLNVANVGAVSVSDVRQIL